MRYLALVLAVLAVSGCSAFQSTLTWPHDAGTGSPPDAALAGDTGPGDDAAVEGDAGTVWPDGSCPPCALGSAAVGECCLQ